MYFADRVRETTTTTGTGTLNLGGTSSGFRTFVDGIGTGKQCYYCIYHQTANEWEVGLGTVTDATPDTLSRTTILASTNSGSAVSFSAGNKIVFNTMPAAKMFDVKVTTTAPTVSDDNTAGYFVGCRWIDTSNQNEYVCLSASTGAAVWLLLSLNGPSSVTDRAIPVWNGTSAKLLANTGVTIASSTNRMTTKATDSAITTVTYGSTTTFDCSLGNKFQVTLTGNPTLALSNVGTNQVIAIKLIQDGTGGRDVTWFSTIKWAGGGTEPDLTATANKADWIVLIQTGSGTYDGFVLGLNV